MLIATATAMIILSGELRRGLLYRLLSTKILAFIGRLSFSLYLWHWPILVFYKYYFNKISLFGYFFCLLLTFLFSFCSWQFFEKPLRYLNVAKKWVVIFYLILPILALVVTAKEIKKNSGFDTRLPEIAHQLYQTSITNFGTVTKNSSAPSTYLPFELLPIGDERLSSDAPYAFLWGDSHGGHFRGFVEELGLTKGFYSLYGGLGGCPPFIGVDLIKHGQPEIECTARNNELLEVIKNSSSPIVFLAGRWAMYTKTTRSPGEKGSRVFLGDSSDYSESVANSRRAFKKGLEATIRELIANDKKPILFEQVPSYSYSPSNCLVKKATYSWLKNNNCNISTQEVNERQAYANRVINDLDNKYSELVVLGINKVICNKNTCVSELNETPLYRDNGHLNMQGSKIIFSEYKKTKFYAELNFLVKKN